MAVQFPNFTGADVDAMTALWVKVDTSKRRANSSYFWYRVALTALIAGVAAALIAAFAA